MYYETWQEAQQQEKGLKKKLVLGHLLSSDPKLSNKGSHSQADWSPPNPTSKDFKDKFFKYIIQIRYQQALEEEVRKRKEKSSQV